jgi:DUF2939 family protein
MRKILAGVVAILVALILFYVVWPYASLVSVVRAARDGDVAAVASRVDWPAMRRSFASQIVAASARITGVPLVKAPLMLSAVASVVDAFVEKLVLPENVGQLMRDGWPNTVLGERPVGIEGLDPEMLRDAWQLLANTDYGIAEVRTALPFHQTKDKQFRLHLSFSGGSWKLSGLDLPVALQDQLARAWLKQQGRED